jgi:HPt (histidine-containing phosphotransfer) domain-containing protein
MNNAPRLNGLLESFQENQPLVEGLVVLFLKHTPELLSEFLRLVRGNHVKEFHGVAFRLKSNLRVLGLLEIQNQVETIGNSFRKGMPSSELCKDLDALEVSILEACRRLKTPHSDN